MIQVHQSEKNVRKTLGQSLGEVGIVSCALSEEIARINSGFLLGSVVDNRLFDMLYLKKRPFGI